MESNVVGGEGLRAAGREKFVDVFEGSAGELQLGLDLEVAVDGMLGRGGTSGREDSADMPAPVTLPPRPTRLE